MSRRLTKEIWRDGGRPLVVIRSYVEWARSSMFAIPVVWIVGAIGLSQLATWVDVRNQQNDALPGFLDTTVESARAILGAISSGTIGAASVVFSLTLVAIQMSSSVYTSRVLRSFLRDRFQQHMIGILLATFTYSLLVLREVRGPLDDTGDSLPYIPRLSVFLAVLFAIGAVIALLASISHTSQSLRASAVTRQIVTELIALIERTFPMRDTAAERDDAIDEGNLSMAGSAVDLMSTGAAAGGAGARVVDTRHEASGVVLTTDRRGWIQQVSLEAIRDAIPTGTSVRLDVSVGRYVGIGTPLLTVWPPPGDDLETMIRDLRGAFAIGEQRSLQQDVAFGLTMIEDIANKALSPGVNDPNTAASVIEQLGEVVLAILEREPHQPTMTLDGCEFTRSAVASHDDTVVAAFNQIRHFSIGQATVQLVLIRTLVEVGNELIRRRCDRDDAIGALTSMLRYVHADLAPSLSDPAAGAAHAELAAVPWYDATGRPVGETPAVSETG